MPLIGKIMVYDVHRIERALIYFVDNAGPDQPVQMHQLIRALVAHLQNECILLYMLMN